MTEHKIDERRLMAAGFMFYGAIVSFIVGLIFLPAHKWPGLAPVGALPFFMGTACYLGFAIRLRRGDTRPVANFKKFAWGNFYLAASILIFFHNYGQYVGYFGDNPESYYDLFAMVIAPLLYIQAIVTLWGKKKTEAAEPSIEDK